MATSQSEKNDTKNVPADVAEIKHKLALRMVFAGLMIVGLLGGLALFDYYSAQPEPEPATPQFTEPVPVAKKPLTQPLTPAEPITQQEVKPVEPESTAAPVDKAAPVVDTPPPPDVAARLTVPRSSAPAARASGPAAAVAPSAPAKSSEARGTPSAAAPAVSEPIESPAAPQASPSPAPPRLFSGYALQAGVFADPRRAEELHARLMLEGIPSTIESRVQVGPFKNKAEAEAARRKLKDLGVEAVMLPPKGARR